MARGPLQRRWQLVDKLACCVHASDVRRLGRRSPVTVRLTTTEVGHLARRQACRAALPNSPPQHPLHPQGWLLPFATDSQIIPILSPSCTFATPSSSLASCISHHTHTRHVSSHLTTQPFAAPNRHDEGDIQGWLIPPQSGSPAATRVVCCSPASSCSCRGALRPPESRPFHYANHQIPSLRI
jgi:hypothetical protein